MTNSDTNPADETKSTASQNLGIIRVYPLHRKPISRSSLWISLIQIISRVATRFFLRDGKYRHQFSIKSTLRLLSAKYKKDLSPIHKNSTIKHISNPTASINPFTTFQKVSTNLSLTTIVSNNIEKANKQSGLSWRQNPANIGADVNLLRFQDKGNGVIATSSNHNFMASLDQSANLKSQSSVKVSDTDFFSKKVSVEATTKNMYVEVYLLTMDDTQALLSRAPDHKIIRYEYKTLQNKNTLLKSIVDVAVKPEKLTKVLKQKAISETLKNELVFVDLTEVELDYLLIRIQQNFVNSNNHSSSVSIDTSLSGNLSSNISNNPILNDCYTAVTSVDIEHEVQSQHFNTSEHHEDIELF